MIRGDWFQKFQTVAGVHQVINQMDLKSTKLTQIISALQDLMTDYKEFQHDFQEFFPRIVKHIQTQYADYSPKNLITVS